MSKPERKRSPGVGDVVLYEGKVLDGAGAFVLVGAMIYARNR